MGASGTLACYWFHWRRELFTNLAGYDCLRLAQQKMAASIGEKLRLEREAHGIALRDISEQTRISMRYLEAIESDDYRRLPGGIFNRSFIRAYAKFVGFDEQEAIEEYTRTLHEHGESEEEDSPKPFRSLVYTDDGNSQRRSPLMTLLLAIIILAVLSLAVWAGLHFYQRSVAPRTNQRIAPGMSPSAQRSSGGTQLPGEVEIAKEDRHEFTV
jgi:cytoskeletal protein RodZ